MKAVSLHSYRYAWAERAYQCGYPERFAQAALGHASKAVRQSYAKGAKVVCPPFEKYEPSVAAKGVNAVPILSVPSAATNRVTREEAAIQGNAMARLHVGVLKLRREICRMPQFETQFHLPHECPDRRALKRLIHDALTGDPSLPS